MDKINAQLGQGKLVQKNQVVGKISLHEATKEGFVHIIKFLLDNGADVNKENDKGWAPLHVAVIFDQLESVKLLVKHPKIDLCKAQEALNTPASLAVLNNRFEILKYFITNKLIDVTRSNTLGYCLIHSAAAQGCIKALELLLKQKETNVNIEGNNGFTPLHLAILANQLEAVKVLILQPDIDINKKNDFGNAPIHLALSARNLAILALLCNQPTLNINILDNIGDTLFHMLIKNAPTSKSIFLTIAKLLVQHDIDLLATDRTGLTVPCILNLAEQTFLQTNPPYHSDGTPPEHPHAPPTAQQYQEKLDVVQQLKTILVNINR